MNKNVYEFKTGLEPCKVTVEQTPYGLFVYLDDMKDPILYVDLYYRFKEASKDLSAGETRVIMYSPANGEDPLAYATVHKDYMVIEPDIFAQGSTIYYKQVENEEKVR